MSTPTWCTNSSGQKYISYWNKEMDLWSGFLVIGILILKLSISFIVKVASVFEGTPVKKDFINLPRENLNSNVGAYLSSSVKTNFLSLRSRRTIPLLCASWTAATICRKSGRAWGSRNRRFVLKIKLIPTSCVVNEHFAKWKLNHAGFDGFSKVHLMKAFHIFYYQSVSYWYQLYAKIVHKIV